MEKLKAAVGFVIPMCNTTRWNSELSMLSGLSAALKKKPSLQDELIAFKKHGKLTKEDLRVVAELIRVLEPFKLATNLFQYDYETVGSVVPAIVDLQNKMNCFSDPTNPKNPISFCIDFAKDLSISLEKRFAFVFNDQSYLAGNQNKF
jgi:hypothetical protein